MRKTSLIVLALFFAESQAVNLSKKHKKHFAAGYGRMEKMGENLKMKGPKRMDSYSYVQAEAEGETGGAAAPTWTVRGEKEWQAWAQDHNDWLDNQTTVANKRIPYHSTLQLSDNNDWIRETPAQRGEV